LNDEGKEIKLLSSTSSPSLNKSLLLKVRLDKEEEIHLEAVITSHRLVVKIRDSMADG